MSDNLKGNLDPYSDRNSQAQQEQRGKKKRELDANNEEVNPKDQKGSINAKSKSGSNSTDANDTSSKIN